MSPSQNTNNSFLLLYVVGKNSTEKGGNLRLCAKNDREVAVATLFEDFHRQAWRPSMFVREFALRPLFNGELPKQIADLVVDEKHCMRFQPGATDNWWYILVLPEDIADLLYKEPHLQHIKLYPPMQMETCEALWQSGPIREAVLLGFEMVAERFAPKAPK